MDGDVKSRNERDARATSRGAPQNCPTSSNYLPYPTYTTPASQVQAAYVRNDPASSRCVGSFLTEKRSATQSSPSSSCGRQKPGQASADNPPLSRATPAREETSIYGLYRVRSHREYRYSHCRTGFVDEEGIDTTHAPAIALAPLPPDRRWRHPRHHRHFRGVLLLHPEGPDARRAIAA